MSWLTCSYNNDFMESSHFICGNSNVLLFGLLFKKVHLLVKHGWGHSVLWFCLLSVHCGASCCYKLKQGGDVSSMTGAEVGESSILQCIRQSFISPSCDDRMVEGTVRLFKSPTRCHNGPHRRDDTYNTSQIWWKQVDENKLTDSLL